MNVFRLKWPGGVVDLAEDSAGYDARRPSLNAIIEISPSAVLEVLKLAGDAKYANELATREVERQRYFEGMARCIVHASSKVGNAVQVICTILPASVIEYEVENKPSVGTNEVDDRERLTERHVGFGVFVQLCTESVDLVLQIDFKVYVLRKFNGIYSLEAFPVDERVVPGSLPELLNGAELKRRAPAAVLLITLWTDPRSSETYSMSTDSISEVSQDQKFAEFHWLDEKGKWRCVDAEEMARLLGSALLKEPFANDGSVGLMRPLLLVKRKQKLLHLVEWTCIAGLVVSTTWNVHAALGEETHARGVAQQSMTIERGKVATPQVNSSVYLANARFIEGLFQKGTIPSFELSGLLASTQFTFGGLVQVSGIELVSAGSATSAMPMNPGPVAKPFAVNVSVPILRAEVVVPIEFTQRRDLMQAIFQRAERTGVRVIQQPADTAGVPAKGLQSGASGILGNETEVAYLQLSKVRP